MPLDARGCRVVLAPLLLAAAACVTTSATPTGADAGGQSGFGSDGGSDGGGPDATLPPGTDASTDDANANPDARAADTGPGDTGAADATCTKPLNKALQFAGGQLVTAPDSESLHVNDLTAEAWVSFATIGGPYQSIIAKPYGTGTGDSFTIWYESGGLHAGASPTSVNDALGYTWAPVLGAWHHVAFTFERATLAQALYVDGALVASGTAPSAPTYDAHPFYIGADVDNGGANGFFNGQIDEVRIWTSVRRIEDIGGDLRTCTPGSFTGLGGYWPLDEGSGQLAADVSGNANNGQLGTTSGVETSDPTWVDSTVPF